MSEPAAMTPSERLAYTRGREHFELGDAEAGIEQLTLLLHLHDIETGIAIERLPDACRLVEELSGIPISKLAPVIGEYTFDHRSPSHLGIPTEFEAFAPALVGGTRQTGE